MGVPRTATLALMAAVLAVGCFDADVGDAVLACGSDDDCPFPLLCDQERCIAGGVGDGDAPGINLDTIEIGASALRPGASTTASFIPSETLGASPTFAGDDLTFELADADDDGRIVATVSVDATAEDGERSITVVLADVAGNVSDPLLLGTLSIDGVVPDVVSVDAPPTAPTGAVFIVRINASEALASIGCNFSVTLAGESVAFAGDVDGADATCAAVVTGSPFVAAVVVDVTLVDLAGNEARYDAVASAGVTL